MEQRQEDADFQRFFGEKRAEDININRRGQLLNYSIYLLEIITDFDATTTFVKKKKREKKRNVCSSAYGYFVRFRLFLPPLAYNCKLCIFLLFYIFIIV